MKGKGFTETISDTLEQEFLDLPAGNGEKKDFTGTSMERGPEDDKLVVWSGAAPVFSDYFNYLATKLERGMEQARPDQGGRILLVTGPGRGSGKSLCSLNLALTYARMFAGATLFLDADARAGSAQRALGFGDSPLPGLADILSFRRRAASVVLDTGMFGLSYLPPGRFSEDLIGRLGDGTVPLLFRNLRQRFRMVVVDTPPAFPLPEAALLARHVDGVLVVLRAGRDGEAHLAQCMEALKGAPILGAVLNDVTSGLFERGYYGPYRYGGYYRSRREAREDQQARKKGKP